MNQYLNPNKVQRQSNAETSWPDVVFLAEAERDTFTDLEIITLSAFKQEDAFERACDIGGSLTAIRRNAKRFESTTIAVEFIEVFQDHIRICLDAEKVDDHLVNRALLILSSMSEFIPGQRMLLNEIPQNPHN